MLNALQTGCTAPKCRVQQCIVCGPDETQSSQVKSPCVNQTRSAARPRPKSQVISSTFNRQYEAKGSQVKSLCRTKQDQLHSPVLRPKVTSSPDERPELQVISSTFNRQYETQSSQVKSPCVNQTRSTTQSRPESHVISSTFNRHYEAQSSQVESLCRAKQDQLHSPVFRPGLNFNSNYPP